MFSLKSGCCPLRMSVANSKIEPEIAQLKLRIALGFAIRHQPPFGGLLLVCTRSICSFGFGVSVFALQGERHDDQVFNQGGNDHL